MRRMITTLCAVAMLAMAVNAMAYEYILQGNKGGSGAFKNAIDLSDGATLKAYWYFLIPAEKTYTCVEKAVFAFYDDKGVDQTYTWFQGDGNLAQNGSGKPQGWFIITPINWDIETYPGNATTGDSYVVTNSAVKGFNLSHAWTDDVPPPPLGFISAFGHVDELVTVEYHKPVYRPIDEGNNTVILAGLKADGTDTSPTVPGGTQNNLHFGYVQLPLGQTSGTFPLAVGAKEVQINVDLSYKIINGEVLLWFDETNENFEVLTNGGIIAIVTDGTATDPTRQDFTCANVMKPGHAAIGDSSKPAKALKWYSPNGDASHKNAVHWLTNLTTPTKKVPDPNNPKKEIIVGNELQAKPGDFLFIHIAGLTGTDFTEIVGCEVDTTEIVTKNCGHCNFHINIYDANGNCLTDDTCDINGDCACEISGLEFGIYYICFCDEVDVCTCEGIEITLTEDNPNCVYDAGKKTHDCGDIEVVCCNDWVCPVCDSEGCCAITGASGH